MYNRLKKILKDLLPKRLLYKWEPALRSVVYQFYKGNRFQCNVCSSKLRSFVHLENGDKLCPKCGSLPRTRRLFDIVQTGFLNEGNTILDFSPPRCLYRVFKKQKGIIYTSSDVSGDFLSDFQYDIRKIPVLDDRYDLVICYHVLEHIDDDRIAMQELYRVTKKGGVCLIQTPFKEGTIYEDFSVQTEQEREIHFGQKDHVRIYSVKGLAERLMSCGFEVAVREFTEEENNKYGFSGHEKVLVCIK